MLIFELLSTFTGVPPGALLPAMLITAVAAALQGTVGFGFGLVSVPLLAMLDPMLSPVPQMLLAFPLTVSMAWSERRGIDWTGFGAIVLGRLPGAALGIGLVSSFDRAGLELLIAVIIGAAVLISLSGRRRPGAADEAPAPPSTGQRFAAGLASGTCSYVAGIGGPPIGLLYRDASGPTLRGTLAAVFVIGLSITLVSRTTAGHIAIDDLRVAVVLSPFMALGLASSRLLRPWVEGPRLRRAVLALSGAAAVMLAARALVG